MKQAGYLLPTPMPLCVSQAVFLNSGISGFEYLDKIVQVPFCLPNLEERKKQAFLSKIVEAKELDPKRVLLRVQKELQNTKEHLYVPLGPKPAGGAGEMRADDRLQALVGAAQCMRGAELLKEDPMRRAEIGISDDGLIEQIETDGDGARDDRKENFLFMLSEEAKRQSTMRQAAAMRPLQLGTAELGAGKDEGLATTEAPAPAEAEAVAAAAAEGAMDQGPASEQSGGLEQDPGQGLPKTPWKTLEAASMLLAAEGEMGKNSGQMAPLLVLWNGVVQARLCESVVENVASTLEVADGKELTAAEAGATAAEAAEAAMSKAVGAELPGHHRLGFGRKRNVCNQEKSAHTVVWEQQVHPAVTAEKAEKERIQKEAEEAATAAAHKAAEQDTKLAALESQAAAAADEVVKQSAEMAALRAQVAEMQALAAPSLQLPTLYI